MSVDEPENKVSGRFVPKLIIVAQGRPVCCLLPFGPPMYVYVSLIITDPITHKCKLKFSSFIPAMNCEN